MIVVISFIVFLNGLVYGQLRFSGEINFQKPSNADSIQVVVGHSGGIVWDCDANGNGVPITTENYGTGTFSTDGLYINFDSPDNVDPGSDGTLYWGDTRAVEPLIAALNEDSDIRGSAAWALAKLSSKILGETIISGKNGGKK